MVTLETPVSRYMSSPVRTIAPEAPLSDAYKVLREHAISCLAVARSDGKPLGVLTRTDLLRVGRVTVAHVRRAPLMVLPDQKVEHVMHAGLVSVAPDATVRDAARVMVAQHIHRVFVTKGDALAGVFSTRDVMQALREAKVRAPLSDYMSSPVVSVRTTDSLAHAVDALREAQVGGLVVTDEDERPVGVFTQVEALQARDAHASDPIEDWMNPAMLCMDLKTPLYRAAAQAAATAPRRVVAVEGRRVWGILTGIDFARAAV